MHIVKNLTKTGFVLGLFLGLATNPSMAQSPASAAPAAAPAASEAPSKLGLGERRAVKKYQDEKYGDLLKAIRAAAGFDLDVDVKWDNIAVPGQAEKYQEDGYWTKIYFNPLIEALKSMGKDDMGKAALKKGLKKVVITFDEASAPTSNYPNGLTMDGGVLTVNWHPYSNIDDDKARTEAVVKLVESKL